MKKNTIVIILKNGAKSAAKKHAVLEEETFLD